MEKSNLSLNLQDLEFLDLLGWNRRVHLLPSTCCAFCQCRLVLLVGLLVFPFLCHLCRLAQGASFLLWITSRPSSELILYYLQIGAFCSLCSMKYLSSPWYPFTDQRSAFFHTQCLAGCSLSKRAGRFPKWFARTLCAPLLVEMLGFFKTV